MSNKTVELSVLLSIINGYELLNVTREEQIEVVSFIHGKPVESQNISSMFTIAVQYLINKYPKLAEAASLVQHFVPDQARYNKLIDLFRKWFEITPMTVHTV